MIFEEGPFPPGEESAEEPWDDVLIITPEDLADCLPPARHHLGTYRHLRRIRSRRERQISKTSLPA